MGRPVKELINTEGQGRQENHARHKAEQDALEKDEPQVGADAEFHKHQRQKTEHRGGSAGGNGGKSPFHRKAHSLSDILSLFSGF